MNRTTWAMVFLMVSTVAWTQSATLPNGFDVFHLGMSSDELKKALKSNSFFIYNGEPDVSLLTRPNTDLIDVTGVGYFNRGVFQLVDGKLYSIALEVNQDQVSYFSLYTTLSKKYGIPTALDPTSSRWESPAVRLTLEKPLTVKYVDMVVFQRLQKQGRAQQALESLNREHFLENF